MSEPERTISQEEMVVLQKKFSEIKHSINNALAVMMALSEMSQRRPDYSEKLASTVLTKAPQIVSSLQEFTQALNDKAGPKPEGSGRRIAAFESAGAYGVGCGDAGRCGRWRVRRF